LRDFVANNRIRVLVSYFENRDPSITIRDGGGGRSEPLALDLSKILGVTYLPAWTQYPLTGQIQDWVDSQGMLGSEIEVRYRTLDVDRQIQGMKQAMRYALQ
jgi:hypothetical protein